MTARYDQSLLGVHTIWFQGRGAPTKRFLKTPPASIGEAIRTAWGWLPLGSKRDATRKLLAKGHVTAKPTSIGRFNTVWFGHGRLKPKNTWNDGGLELFAFSVWGAIPLWDGRTCLAFPGNEHCERRVYGYDPTRERT